MSRRGFLRLAAALLALLLAGGCSRLYEKEYSSVTRHEESTDLSRSDVPYYEVHTYLGMKNAVQGLIAAGAETGTVHAVDYSGSVQDDISRVCLEATRDYPLGAYAVEYISQSVNRILSYYEIKLRISYHLSAEEILSVRTASSLGDVYAMMELAAVNGTEHLAVETSTLTVTERALNGYVEGYYRKHPELLASMPKVTVTFHPSEESVSKIVEFDFSYREPHDDAQARLEAVRQTAESIAAEYRGEDAGILALVCCTSVARSILNPSGGDTAYDALVLGSSGSEGCAMAYQLLCNECGLECQVVEGRVDGARRYWNIIRIGGSYYHVDAYACISEAVAEAFLRSDDEMRLRYWWDVNKYPACGGELTAQQILDELLPPETAEPEDEAEVPSEEA